MKTIRQVIGFFTILACSLLGWSSTLVSPESRDLRSVLLMSAILCGAFGLFSVAKPGKSPANKMTLWKLRVLLAPIFSNLFILAAAITFVVSRSSNYQYNVSPLLGQWIAPILYFLIGVFLNVFGTSTALKYRSFEKNIPAGDD